MKDLEHIILECSSCDAKLVDVWIIEETEEVHQIKAVCMDCGDGSFYKEVKGKFYIGCTSTSRLQDIQTEDDNKVLVHAKTENQ